MKYKYLFILLITLNACKKEAITDPISLLTFAPDHILQKTNSPFYLGLGFYLQERQYKADENLSLTVGGVAAKLVKRQLVEGRTTALFQVPGISNEGDHKVIFKYSIGSSSFTEERTIRTAKDFSPASIWSKLDYAYARQNLLTYVYPSNDFQFEALGIISLVSTPKTGSALSIGEYRLSFANSSNAYVSKPFITGLDGKYTAYYENNSLKEIWVSIADTYTDPFFNLNELITELTKQYGAPVNISGKYVFRAGAFDIEIDYYRYVQAIVKKVR